MEHKKENYKKINNILIIFDDFITNEELNQREILLNYGVWQGILIFRW